MTCILADGYHIYNYEYVRLPPGKLGCPKNYLPECAALREIGVANFRELIFAFLNFLSCGHESPLQVIKGRNRKLQSSVFDFPDAWHCQKAICGRH